MQNRSNRLWLTYAWKDNEDGNVDYIVSRMENEGIDVLIDKTNLVAGRRLWDQIDSYISNPKHTDAWAIYVTRNALDSEPCQEELSYALDRALRTRGSSFPIIGLFQSAIPRELIPSSIATRLYLFLSDPDWAQKISSSLSGTPLRKNIDPSPISINKITIENKSHIIFNPRINSWPSAGVFIPNGSLNTNKDPVDIFNGPVQLRKFRGNLIETSGILHREHRCVQINGEDYELYTITGPFDHITKVSLNIDNYSGKIILAGISGDIIIDGSVFIYE